VIRRALVTAACVVITACGGGGGGDGGGITPPPPPVINRSEAARFLRQATFGPTAAEIDRVVQVGYDRWLDQQFAAPPSLHTPALKALGRPSTQEDRRDEWARLAVRGNDQLRQRVAFALSQILVVSERSALGTFPTALTTYYDVLVRNAFGNYRTLLEEVTLNPGMGVYLSMLGNQKPDVARNIRPDENYARELMQLFTIGLVELNADGTVRRDAQGLPIPTYDQAAIESFSHVYTGWMFGGSAQFWLPSFDFEQPMQPFEAFHDQGPKALLRGATLPAGQTARQDLAGALDNLFAHPNVGPFISRQLIQRLVSSNPSPAYVGRVAARFANNGAGVRGDLQAVVRAILTDTEARQPPAGAAGKLEEPLVRVMALWRAFDARSTSGRYPILGIDYLVEQSPLGSPSVFNFYRPDFAPPGEMRTLGLVAPEMEITTETTSANLANVLAFSIYANNSSATNLAPETVYIDISTEVALAADAPRLVDQVANKLVGGGISTELRNEVIAMVERIPAAAGSGRAAEAIHDIVTAPEYAVLK
jgi:uncharacterized protein (DUF1800 family)